MEGVAVSDGQNSQLPSASLIAAFVEMAQRLRPTEDLDSTAGQLSAVGQSVIPGCDGASLSLLRKDGPLTLGATNSLAADGDRVQYEEGEGPCLDAAMHERWLHIRDLAGDPRWPRSSHRLSAELGVHSMISCRLTLDAAPRDTLGGINFYSLRRNAFTEDDLMLAVLLSSLGAVLIDAAHQQANLRAAIESRQVIGEAMGILRAQSNVSSDQAFAMLAQASQRMNVKLRDLAARISAGVGSAQGTNESSRATP